MNDSPFPIQLPDRYEERKYLEERGVIIHSVPWGLMVEHEVQAKRNHDQTIAELARRCGLSACEAVAVLEDREWRHMPLDEAYVRLGDIEKAWRRQHE
jgi:hypothetical protein